jgi:serine/threonine protein kinase/tetratricopeptide (TPR) repeat protein
MIGQHLSHYEIVEKLGEGGMGVVYKARDSRLERFVAIKILPSERAVDPLSRRRFLREAQAASILNHPHIVTIYDIATEDGMDLIVMEHVDGHSLKRLIPPGGLQVAEAVEFALQMAGALSTAHRAGIIHRDLKPANVMVNRDRRVKILDFGLAKQILTPRADSVGSITQAGVAVGTVMYMAPEQAMGLAMDHRADIFSFGVTLYEMLTGTLPFPGANDLAILHAICYDDPMPLREVRTDLPAGLEDLVRRMLAKSPERRFATMWEVEFGLRRIAAELAGAPPVADNAPTQPVPLSGTSRSSIGSSATTASAEPASKPYALAHSIAVLPFRCLSTDQEDVYTAEGIATEIVTALSGVPGLRVASQLAAARFQESATDLRVIAENLKVRYLLTGSLRRAGNRIRLIAELSDAAEDRVVWTRTYSRALEDIFALQEEIARAVVGAAGGQILRLRAEEASRVSVELLDAAGLVRKAYHFWNHAFHVDGVQESLDLLRRAVQMDPKYAPAHAHLGFYLNERVMVFISPDREADRAECKAAADRAFELAPGDPEVLECVGLTWFCTGQHQKAVPALRRAVEIAPLNLVAWGYLAMTLGWGGDEREVAEAQEILDRLIAETPDHPSLPYWYYFKAGACFRMGDYERAAACARKTYELQPRYIITKLALANALGALGKLEEARAAWNETLAVNPNITQAAFMETILAIARTPERAEPHIMGLKAAGIFQ